MVNVRALTLAGVVAAGATYVVCAVAVALAPAATTAMAGAVVHADLSSLTRVMSWSIFFAGLAFWMALAAVFFSAVGWMYNAFRDEVRVGTPATKPGTA